MKRQQQPQSITLSGSVSLRTPTAPKLGDLVVMPNDSTWTRNVARKNDKFSLGFPGYLIAYIFDGRDWGRLELWGILSDRELKYQFRHQAPHRLKASLTPLHRLEGRVAVRCDDDPYGRYMFKLKA